MVVEASFSFNGHLGCNVYKHTDMFILLTLVIKGWHQIDQLGF